MSNPLWTRAIAAAKRKTDKIDAQVLAELQDDRYIPEVWQPDAATIELRSLVAHRAGLVGVRTAQRNRVHAILGRALLALPVADAFGVAGRAWLAGLALSDLARLELDAALRLHDAAELEIAGAERVLAMKLVDDPRARHLLTIPGVGPAVAASLVALVGDIWRFPRPANFASYLGLDPRVRQTGGKPAFTGNISRAGQAHARGLLIEAAHAAVKVPGPCARSTCACGGGTAPAWRSWRWPASSRCSPGTCSARTRTIASARRSAPPRSSGAWSSSPGDRSCHRAAGPGRQQGAPAGRARPRMGGARGRRGGVRGACPGADGPAAGGGRGGRTGERLNGRPEPRGRTPTEAIPADIAVCYVRELPETWRKAEGGPGRQLLASALFSRIEVLGVKEATVHLSEHAVRHGLAAALPAEMRILVMVGARAVGSEPFRM